MSMTAHLTDERTQSVLNCLSSFRGRTVVPLKQFQSPARLSQQRSRSVEPPCVAPGRDAADLSGLPQAVVDTITQARAPSTRQAYALKWSLFANWYYSRREDPRRCMIGVVLSFLQERLERRLSPSTLKVYVAAIASHHDAVDGRSLGKYDLIVRFLRGARRLNPPRSPLVPSWDLSIVLAGLQRGPFEPLDSVELRFLSAKTALLTALTSIKRVGELQAFSVSEVIKDSNHPGNRLFILLPSGKRFRSLMAKTERLRRSFFPQAIRLLNS